MNETFGVCVEKANALGVADTWSTFCMRQLEIADPVTFPRFREKIAKPRAWDVPLQVAD